MVVNSSCQGLRRAGLAQGAPGRRRRREAIRRKRSSKASHLRRLFVAQQSNKRLRAARQDHRLLVLRVALTQGVQALGRALAERLALVIAERAGGERRGRALLPQQIDERRQAAALADRRLVCFVVDC